LNYIYFEYLGSCKKKLQKLALVIILSHSGSTSLNITGSICSLKVFYYMPDLLRRIDMTEIDRVIDSQN